MANLVLQQTTLQKQNAMKILSVPLPPGPHPGDPSNVTLVSPGGSNAGTGTQFGQLFPIGTR